MPEFFTNISNQITEYLARYTRKQKIQMIAIAAVAVLALAALVYFLSRPQYKLYAENISASEMNEMVATLESNNVLYRYEDNASKLYVEAPKYQDVKLMLAKDGILSTRGFKWADAFNSSLTTTSGQRDMMQQLAFESEVASYLTSLNSVSDAKVKFVMPESNNAVLKKEQKASASVILTLVDELTDDQIYGIASWISELVNNLSIENIKILESKTSRLLFNGASNKLGGASSYLDITNLYEKKYEKDIELLLFNSGGVDDAIVDVNLVIDFDKVETEETTHQLPESMETSLPTKVYVYESTGSSTDASGVPGTDSNAKDSTTYVVDNGGGSDSTVTVEDTDYAVDTKVTKKLKAEGEIVHDKSSVSVVLRKYKIYDEEVMKKSGALDGTTWEQFKLDNSGETKLVVGDEIVSFVKNASLIENVSILSYEVAVFNDKVSKPIDFKTYIPIALVAVLVALLGYAVFKGVGSTEVTEIEPELSVEDMLSTTKEEEVEEIEFTDKSNTRVKIEHFVDENPEAIAQLLRNWLHEDWD